MSDTGHHLVRLVWPMLPPDRRRAVIGSLGQMLLRQLRVDAPVIPVIGEAGDDGIPPAALGLVPEKINRRHRDRTAIVYVRQSTVQQVQRHQESTRLQYALADRAFGYGWARGDITIIDDDLGRSGATVEGRPGFQRLVAEVGLGHVGLVLGVEMSRLARSCRDWHQLLEICAIFDTLIADADGV